MSLSDEVKRTNENIDKLNRDFGKIEIKNYSYELMKHPLSFVKRNGIVSMCYDGDWYSIPTGHIGTIIHIDPQFYPVHPVRCMAFPGVQLQMTLSTQGELDAYNYGNEFTAIKAGRFFISYVAAN